MKENTYNKKHSAFDTAVYFVSIKDRTIKEMRDKLIDKGYDDDEIENAIDKMLYYGYLNDKKYASLYISCNKGKKGKKLITNELISKGIDKEDIQDAFEVADLDEASVVKAIYDRRFKDMDIEDPKTRRKITSYFLRRGFSYDSINIIFLTHWVK